MRILEILGSVSLLVSIAFIAGYAFNQAIDSVPLALGLTFLCVSLVAFGLAKYLYGGVDDEPTPSAGH